MSTCRWNSALVVANIRAELTASRDGKPAGTNGLPRAIRSEDGRFVLDNTEFPGYVAYDKLSDLWAWRVAMVGQTAPIPSDVDLDALLPVLEVDGEALHSPPSDKAQVTWLGHASVLMQFNGWTVLADPIFSERCSPTQWVGPSRFRRSPIDVVSLPRVDAVVISHNHYDHLDELTVLALARHHPDAVFFVPLGTAAWFTEVGLVTTGVVEMDWSEEAHLPGAQGSRPPLAIACVPCQHWCARGITDRNKCLWASWVCHTPEFSLFFGGDTGYSPMFKRVGEAFGPFDCSAIPIGAYGAPAERWFHKPNHMDPDEAVRCHLDLRSHKSIAIHFGTFQLTGEPVLEPPKLLEAAKLEHSVPTDAFVCLKHGETLVLPMRRKWEWA